MRAARRQTRASTSAWPPTALVCAILHLPTSTCEVGNSARQRQGPTVPPCPIPSLGSWPPGSPVLCCPEQEGPNPIHGVTGMTVTELWASGVMLVARWVGGGWWADLGPTGLGEPEGHCPPATSPPPKLACVVCVPPVSCWLRFSEPVASWLPASLPRPVSSSEDCGEWGFQAVLPPGIPEPSARSRRNKPRPWEARATAHTWACGLVARHAAGPLGPHVDLRIPGSCRYGWKPRVLDGRLPCLHPQEASFGPLVHPHPRGTPGTPVCLYQLACSPSSPSLSFPAVPLAFTPLHPGRPAGCPSPSSPCFPWPLVNSFGSWLWVLHLGSKQEAVWREGEWVGGGPV